MIKNINYQEVSSKMDNPFKIQSILSRARERMGLADQISGFGDDHLIHRLQFYDQNNISRIQPKNRDHDYVTYRILQANPYLMDETERAQIPSVQELPDDPEYLKNVDNLNHRYQSAVQLKMRQSSNTSDKSDRFEIFQNSNSVGNQRVSVDNSEQNTEVAPYRRNYLLQHFIAPLHRYQKIDRSLGSVIQEKLEKISDFSNKIHSAHESPYRTDTQNKIDEDIKNNVSHRIFRSEGIPAQTNASDISRYSNSERSHSLRKNDSDLPEDSLIRSDRQGKIELTGASNLIQRFANVKKYDHEVSLIHPKASTPISGLETIDRKNLSIGPKLNAEAVFKDGQKSKNQENITESINSHDRSDSKNNLTVDNIYNSLKLKLKVEKERMGD